LRRAGWDVRAGFDDDSCDVATDDGGIYGDWEDVVVFTLSCINLVDDACFDFEQELAWAWMKVDKVGWLVVLLM
jgi:hypothetical protein